MTTQETIKPLVDSILSNPLQFKKASMNSDASLDEVMGDPQGNKTNAPYIVIGNKGRYAPDAKYEPEDAEEGTESPIDAVGPVVAPTTLAEALKMYTTSDISESVGSTAANDAVGEEAVTTVAQDAGHIAVEESVSAPSASSSDAEEFHEAKQYVEGDEDVGMPLESGSGSDGSDDQEYKDTESGSGSSDSISHVSEDEKAQLREEARESKSHEDELKHKLPLSQRSVTPPIEIRDISKFYQLNEDVNDKGSNFSSRIVKNWGPDLTVLKPRGLLNHGVTCYTNAAVQAMLHIPAIQHYLFDILRGKYENTIDRNSVSYVLAETSRKMWIPQDKSKKKSGTYFINPKKLISRLDDINCMMSEWQQEDSHEYFMSLMSRLQEDSVPKGHKMTESIVYDIFGGLLKQNVTCKSCGYVSKTEQPFYDLSLHLKGKKNAQLDSSNAGDAGDAENRSSTNGESNKQEPSQTSRRFSIEKSIKDFFNTELIKVDKEQKGYVCENCQKTTNALKHNSIIRAPETLLIHLKKFRFNGSSSSKMKQAVSYPMFLDLTEYCEDKKLPVKYQLINVVVHEGRSLSSGHYIVHCRQPDGSWATYDDEYINKITERDVLKEANAYYLLYTRLTPKEIPLNGSKGDSKGLAKEDLNIPMSNNASTPTSSPVINRSKKWKKNKRKRLNH